MTSFICSFVILGLALSCAGVAPLRSDSLPSRLAGREQKLHQHPIVSKSEVAQILQRRRQNLKEVFTQSFDPYYNTPRWDEVCLQENKIHDIVTIDGHSFFSAALFLNQSGEAGFCPNDDSYLQPLKHHVVYYHCAGDGFVTRLQVEFKTGDDAFPWRQLCP
jgi:hypothetical protein